MSQPPKAFEQDPMGTASAGPTSHSRPKAALGGATTDGSAGFVGKQSRRAAGVLHSANGTNKLQSLIKSQRCYHERDALQPGAYLFLLCSKFQY